MSIARVTVAMRPGKVRRLLLLAGFGAMSAGVFLADFTLWVLR
jgi:hypothetical protein